MKNYLLGIGGSGSRVLRSVVHNCAAGVIDIDEINTLILDADEENAAWKNAVEDIQEYKKMQKVLLANQNGNSLNGFHTKINLISEDHVISPVNYGKYNSLKDAVSGESELERVMGWLFSEEEKTKNLKDGFFARPNVGCVFFSHFDNTEFNYFLQELLDTINKKEQVNIMMIGSVFGGTGASGLPTLLKLIEKEMQHYEQEAEYNGLSEKAAEYLNIGAVFMMPYFTAEDTGGNEKRIINIKDFWKASKYALEYYKEEKYFEINNTTWHKSFYNLYLIGQKNLDLVNVYSEGGEKQDNKPHIAEEYAAFAVSDFFAIKSMEFDSKKEVNIFYKMISENIKWDDLSCNFISKRKLGDFMRFATIYHTSIFPYIENKRPDKYKSNKLSDNIFIPQWYKKYACKKIDKDTFKELQNIEKYCQNYLNWFYMIQSNMEIRQNQKSYSYNKKIELFGDVLENVKDTMDNASGKVENFSQNVAEIKKKFSLLIIAGEDISYMLKEVFLILSKLGITAAMAASGNVSGLVAALMQLVSLKKG